MVQVPTFNPVTVVPLIEQTDAVSEAKVGDRPELVVAETVPFAGLVIVAGTVRVIVCDDLPTVTLWVTCVAGL